MLTGRTLFEIFIFMITSVCVESTYSILSCDNNGFSESMCQEGCCVDPDRWGQIHCCDYRKTTLLLAQIIVQGVFIIGSVITIVVFGCICRKRRNKTGVQAQAPVVATSVQYPTTVLYPHTGPPPNPQGQPTNYQQQTPTYQEPHPSSSYDLYHLPPIALPHQPEKHGN